MVPWWQRRFEAQSPSGRRATAWLQILIAAVWIILILLGPRPLRTIDKAALGLFSLALVLWTWGLISMDERGVTVFGRLGERKVLGRELADWWTFVFSLALAAASLLIFPVWPKWVLASAFALLALYGAWRLIRPPAQTKTLPPLTRATWPVETPE